MNKPSIPIKPIDFDVAKRAVDEFVVERGVPTHVYPQGQAVPETGQTREGAAKPARAPGRKFTVVLPEYVIDAINARTIATKPKTTSRYVILEALRALGIAIHDDDMVVDGRRTQ